MGEFEEYLDELYPYICEGFNIPKAEPSSNPGFILPGNREGRESMEKHVGTHHPVYYIEGLSTLYLDKFKLSEDSISAPSLGEELAHYLREEVGPRSGKPPDEDFVKYQSCEEFFGRLGYRLAADKLDQNVEEISLEELKPSDVLLKGYPDDPSLEEVRNDLLEPVSQAYVKRDSNPTVQKSLEQVRELWEWMAHYAGYEAADENYPEVLEDRELIYKSPEEVREEFELSEKELQFLERKCDIKP